MFRSLPPQRSFHEDQESTDNIALGLECWLPHALEGSKEKSHCHLPTLQRMNKAKQNKTKTPAPSVLQPGSFLQEQLRECVSDSQTQYKSILMKIN